MFARGWCSRHYSRWQRHGSPHVTTRTPPAAPDATTKKCPRCCEIKDLDNFGRRPSGRPKGYCKKCEAAYQRQHAATETGREQHRTARSKWNENNYEYFLQYRYGITGEDYDRMLTEQDGKCAICGTTEPGCGNSRWAVDHCHDSLDVRGLLCMNCNTGLGYFKDSTERLRSAVAYLERT